MAMCKQCGAVVDDSAKVCPTCGAVMEQAAPVQAPVQQGTNPNDAINKSVEQVTQGFQNLNNTADSTAEYDPSDVQANKTMSVLAYIGILFLIPMLAAPQSKFARFHTNQGLVLFICEIVFNVALAILRAILAAISHKLVFITTILGLVSWAFVILAILGIVNAAQGRAKELPLIGGIRILK